MMFSLSLSLSLSLSHTHTHTHTGISQTAAFQCPPDHYPYPNDACSSCFTIVDGGLNFEAAQGHCILLGGELTTIQNETDFELLSRYLGGLRETRKLWIGYRLTNSGSRIGLEGNEAPDVVRDDNNFNGSTSGDDNSCIGIWNGKFIVAPCTNALPFICTIVYNGEWLQDSLKVSRLEVVSSFVRFYVAMSICGILIKGVVFISGVHVINFCILLYMAGSVHNYVLIERCVFKVQYSAIGPEPSPLSSLS